jgi:hypothetical protein
MKARKKQQLEAHGWHVGSVDEFVGLSAAEAAYIELKFALSAQLKQCRQQRKLTQGELAERLDSNQSRVANDVPCAAAPGLTTQQTALHASERDTPRIQQARQDYRWRIRALDLRRLKFVDESSVHLAMTRRYGRVPAGERIVGSVPRSLRRVLCQDRCRAP